MTEHEKLPEKSLHLDCAVATLAALTEAGIPADVQELLVRGDASRGIAAGALSKAVKAANDTVFAALQEPTRSMWVSGGNFVVKNLGRHHGVMSGGVWKAMLAASPLAGEKRGAE